jgi:hypothetical protein
MIALTPVLITIISQYVLYRPTRFSAMHFTKYILSFNIGPHKKANNLSELQTAVTLNATLHFTCFNCHDSLTFKYPVNK